MFSVFSARSMFIARSLFSSRSLGSGARCRVTTTPGHVIIKLTSWRLLSSLLEAELTVDTHCTTACDALLNLLQVHKILEIG